ncbi:hypothetical protein [Streptomyces resistomycificus]|uniref:hypothetical protein n=1 Tax=Streptomyces resistomycificus TaxID=67356 RepID=UPI000AA4CF96|nr:hypothetical protein [Streptomyces resistomycificus]
MKKTREQMVADNMWGSAALFVCAAFFSFVAVRTDGADKVGWILYLCGWIPPTGMAIWCLTKRRNLGVGGAFSFLLLMVSGVLFWLNHG